MRAAVLAVAFMLLATAPASAAPELVKLGDFSNPVHVASPPNDSRVFVVEQDGLVKIVGGGTFIDLTGPTESDGYEQGLLSIAFRPDYATSGLFYVFLTAEDGDVEVREYRRSAADPNVADPTLIRTLLNEDHPADNHNGGQLQFGPDGALYVSIGDNAQAGNAQDPSSPFGKIHRIDTASGTDLIWSSGLRNPWRFSFDRATGDLLIGDVGQNRWEEVDWSRAPNAGQGVAGQGVNYGWPCAEGFDGSCGTPPAFARSHDDGYEAIIGGYVVRDPGLPSLTGRYLYGDANLSTLRSVVLPNTDDRAEPLPVSALSSFGEDSCGHIYVTSLAGAVYRIQDGQPSACATGAPHLRASILERKGRRLRIAVRCDEACRVAVSTRLEKVRRLATRRRSLAANQRTVVSIRMSRATAKRLRNGLARRGFVRVAMTVRATDAAGNRTVVTRRGRIEQR